MCVRYISAWMAWSRLLSVNKRACQHCATASSEGIEAMTTNDIHVVFGANGGSGAAIVRQLVAQGKRVRAVSRSGGTAAGGQVEVVRADASDAASARAACKDATAVYHCVGVPYSDWAARLPPIMEALIGAAGAASAPLVYVDNLYMYGPQDRPLTEDMPYRATGKKGMLRAQLAERLLAAHANGQVRATIARSSEFYGPGVSTAYTNDAWFRGILAGKQAMWVGNLDVPHTMTYIDDFARAVVTLGEQPEALGEVWHVPTAPALSGREFLTLAFAEAEQPAKISSLPRWMLQLVGLVNPQAREFAEVVYMYERPFTVDGTKFTQAFGFTPTPQREAIGATLDWLRAPQAAVALPQ